MTVFPSIVVGNAVVDGVGGQEGNWIMAKQSESMATATFANRPPSTKALAQQNVPRCPWCGRPMIVQRRKTPLMKLAYFLHCRRPECPIQPRSKYSKSAKELIKAWQNR